MHQPIPAVTRASDAVELAFYELTKARDAATGPEKTKLRRLTKHIDGALHLMEAAEDEIENDDTNLGQPGPQGLDPGPPA